MESGVTCCECSHLTSFGSGFFVAPNTIDFNYVFAHADFMANKSIYATLIVMFSVFIILLIYARWKDRKDVQKVIFLIIFFNINMENTSLISQSCAVS